MWPRGVLSCGLLFTALGAAQPGPGYVEDCHPCTFTPSAAAGQYAFYFDMENVSGGRRVKAIRVERGQTTAGNLAVGGMMAVAPGDQIFFDAVDVNFDGALDLMLITDKGAANASAMYWLFDPKTGTYSPLGKYPVFQVHSEVRRLTTYERGGAGGMVYEAKEYGFEAGVLTLMRTEAQEATSRPNIYRKVVRARVMGVMKIIRTETVRGRGLQE